MIRELQADAVVPEIHTTLSQNTNLDDLLCSLQCKENIATLRTFFLCPVYSIAHHIHKLPILLSILSFLILLLFPFLYLLAVTVKTKVQVCVNVMYGMTMT